jgi:hypothetical protein
VAEFTHTKFTHPHPHLTLPSYPHIHTDISTKKMARAHHVPIVGSTYLSYYTLLLPCKNLITSHIDAFCRFHHGRQTSFQTSKIRIDAIASAPPPSPLSVPRIEDGGTCSNHPPRGGIGGGGTTTRIVTWRRMPTTRGCSSGESFVEGGGW